MRSVSLSNKQVISLLNRYFVNVFVSNEDFTDKGSASKEDKAQLRRIFQEGYAAHLSVGTVHVYVLRPDGHLLDSMHVAQAAQGGPLIAMLEKDVGILGTQPGLPVVKPAPPPVPKAEPGTLMLHVVARYLERRGDDYILTGQGEHRGNWSDNPGEDWVALTPRRWRAFLPPGAVRIGESWKVDPDAAALLWNRFYPPTENNDLSQNRIDAQSLTATLVSVQNGTAQARLEGSLKMKHPFYHKDDANFVTATAVGFVDFDTRSRRIETLQLVTEQADYGTQSPLPFGAAVNSLPMVFPGKDGVAHRTRQ